MKNILNWHSGGETGSHVLQLSTAFEGSFDGGDEDFLLCDSVSWIQQSYKYTYIYKPAISKISQLGIL